MRIPHSILEHLGQRVIELEAILEHLSSAEKAYQTAAANVHLAHNLVSRQLQDLREWARPILDQDQMEWLGKIPF